MTVNACVSFRACPKVLRAFFSSIKPLNKIKIPSHTTIQRWMASVGYYKLHMPLEKADDWIVLVDESIQVGSQKYLVVLGCRAKYLPKGRSLELADLIPLYAVVLTKSDGKAVKRALDVVTLRVGRIMAICSDEGSNLKLGYKLYQKEHPHIQYIPDIVHKLANIIKKQLNNDPDWGELIKLINSTKLKIYNSSLGHLTPPALRGKSRFLNLDIVIEWALKVIRLLNEGNASPEYDSEAVEKNLGWLRQFEDSIKSYASLLKLVSVARHLVRQRGIHQYIADDFAMIFEEESPQEGWDIVTTRIANQIYEFLDQQGNKVKKDQVLLGSSEAIETFFGKYKSMEGNQTKAGFSGLVLAGLAHIGPLDQSTVQAAMETVKNVQVNDWVKKYVGITVHAKRCTFLKKSQKNDDSQFIKNNETGQERALSFEGKVMGF